MANSSLLVGWSKSARLIHPSRTTWIASRCLSSSATSTQPKIPESLKRVGQPDAFPNEYPGQNYAFNWCLNGDGVTPLRRSAFRITKPLDLKIAGLTPPAKMPLKVKPASLSTIPEAGSDKLTFEQFDEISQRTRNLLSLSDHLYCPEGHVPKTRTGVRVITNSATLAPALLAYLERAPKKDPPESLPITCYVLEGTTEESFIGYAIEEIEAPVTSTGLKADFTWAPADQVVDAVMEAKSVASVVYVGSKPDISKIVAGIELCQQALAADEVERKSKVAADAKAKE